MSEDSTAEIRRRVIYNAMVALLRQHQEMVLSQSMAQASNHRVEDWHRARVSERQFSLAMEEFLDMVSM